MTDKTEVTPTEMRKALKAMGYTVRIKQGSQFSMATVTKDGDTVSGTNIMGPDYYKKHKEFFDYKNTHSVIDEDGWRTML